jgi:hypothetical protein
MVSSVAFGSCVETRASIVRKAGGFDKLNCCVLWARPLARLSTLTGWIGFYSNTHRDDSEQAEIEKWWPIIKAAGVKGE